MNIPLKDLIAARDALNIARKAWIRGTELTSDELSRVIDASVSLDMVIQPITKAAQVEVTQ